MHTVVPIPAFLRQAKHEGMTEEEIDATIDMISADPMGGDLIVGSGGYRKVRVAGRGKGKSGGYRVVTYFVSDNAPVLLIAVLSKGTRENFSNAEVNAMAKAADQLVASFGPLAFG